MAVPQSRNLRGSLDVVVDTLVNDRRFRILALVDDFTRECLGLVVDTSLNGLRVVRELDRIIELRNGTDLTSNAIPDPAAGTRCRMALGQAGEQVTIKYGGYRRI